MTEFVKELQLRYSKARNLKINKFLEEHKDDMEDLKALLRYAADHSKSKASFMAKNQCIMWQKFAVKPSLQKFIIEHRHLIAEATGLEIKVAAFGNTLITVSFEKEVPEDE